MGTGDMESDVFLYLADPCGVNYDFPENEVTFGMGSAVRIIWPFIWTALSAHISDHRRDNICCYKLDLRNIL